MGLGGGVTVSTRTVTIVILALLSGAAAAVGINAAIKQSGGSTGEMVPVVVAAVDVPRFTMLAGPMLRTRDYPKDLVPADAVTKLDDALDRGTITGLAKDEVIIAGRLSAKGQMGVAPGVPVGMRAVTI